jgi:hypothetical protein
MSNVLNDENKKLIEKHSDLLVSERSVEKEEDPDFDSLKKFILDFKSFVEKDGLTSSTSAPAQIQTIPLFINVVEHIPEDKMPRSVYFLVPDDLPINDKIIAKYRFVNMNSLPQELKRVIVATLNFGSELHDKSELIDLCKSLLESAEKINT